MSPLPVIAWFRNDLRLDDNPALHAARESGAPVIPVYIYDKTRKYAHGGAAKWWLHHSLKALSDSLDAAGAQLILRSGSEASEISELAEETNASAVYWNRRYVREDIETDKSLKASLKEDNIDVQTFNGSLLREPWEVKTQSGDAYRVFTPFWKSLKDLGPVRKQALPQLRKIDGLKSKFDSEKLGNWKLTPTSPNWAEGFEEEWAPGEKGAHNRLKEFLKNRVYYYANGRDQPAAECTSKLSPHLAFGEISPLRIWNDTQGAMESGDVNAGQGLKFLSEIAWREFAYSLLFNNGDLPIEPLRKEFTEFNWKQNKTNLKKWQKGKTGYPIVDAGMRQLWQTGWMHNRVRMIVASFLIKDLLIPWQDGAAWFWDTLVDADLANNSASWQWVAGCGTDASPYFRIFNPILQGEKFDPDGDYIGKFVPELKKMPSKYIHKPWEASKEILADADVNLGKTYPEPMIDHSFARNRALEEYKKIKVGDI